MITYETNADAMFLRLKRMLGDISPDFELRHKAELAVEINRLKAEKNAVILGHNYMEPALFHSIPDYVGDSLELCRKAAAADADIIVFCGVEFMAETAKVLNPTKTVLLPCRESRLLAGREHHRRRCTRSKGALPRHPGGDLCQHLRGCQGGIRYLLHVWQCRRRGRIAE